MSRLPIGTEIGPWDYSGQPSVERFNTVVAQRDELLAALKAVAETADDCPVCDRGRLRNPQKTHWPECPFGRAQAVIAKAEGR